MPFSVQSKVQNNGKENGEIDSDNHVFPLGYRRNTTFTQAGERQCDG